MLVSFLYKLDFSLRLVGWLWLVSLLKSLFKFITFLHDFDHDELVGASCVFPAVFAFAEL